MHKKKSKQGIQGFVMCLGACLLIAGIIGKYLAPHVRFDSIVKNFTTRWMRNGTPNEAEKKATTISAKPIYNKPRTLKEFSARTVAFDAGESLAVRVSNSRLVVNQQMPNGDSQANSNIDNRWSIDAHGYVNHQSAAAVESKETFVTQSPLSEFIFSGSANLVNGSATVAFTKATSEIIDPNAPLKISLTQNTSNPQGLYIISKSIHGFKVKEVTEGTADVAFDWLVVAKRK